MTAVLTDSQPKRLGCCDVVTSPDGLVGIRMMWKDGTEDIVAFKPDEALAMAERIARAAVSLICQQACPPTPVAQA